MSEDVPGGAGPAQADPVQGDPVVAPAGSADGSLERLLAAGRVGCPILGVAGVAVVLYFSLKDGGRIRRGLLALELTHPRLLKGGEQVWQLFQIVGAVTAGAITFGVLSVFLAVPVAAVAGHVARIRSEQPYDVGSV